MYKIIGTEQFQFLRIHSTLSLLEVLRLSLVINSITTISIWHLSIQKRKGDRDFQSILVPIMECCAPPGKLCSQGLLSSCTSVSGTCA